MFFLYTLLPLSLLVRAQYKPSPRWGQAAVLVNSNLYVHGGKTDQYNSISYTQAPGTSETLYLDLSKSFDTGSVPWELISTQGPAVAWHSIAATNTSFALSFGGLPDANTEPVLPDQRDSSWLLDVSSRTEPRWIDASHPWADEPPRRIHHTATTLPDGRILIFGGQKTDGSSIVHSDHYIIDASIPQYTVLNTTAKRGPADIYGHASVIHPDGYVVVVGGTSPSTGGLVSFDTIDALHINHPQPYWVPITIDGPVPPPRVDFASAVLSDGRILIHGGGDGSASSAYSDGWILEIDFVGKTGAWSPVPELSQLGPRKDHFIVPAGDHVIIGFGYGANGPSGSGLTIYNPETGTFGNTHTPPDYSSSTPSPTMPGSSETGTPGDGDGNENGGGSGTDGDGPNGSGGNGGSGNGDGNGNSGGNGNGDGGNGSGGNNGGDGNGDEDGDGDDGGGIGTNDGTNNKTTTIAVGVTLGILALLAVGIGAALYIRRQRREQRYAGQFRQIDDNEPDAPNGESPHFTGTHAIPAAHPYGEKSHNNNNRGLLGAFGLGALALGHKGGRAPQRKDMLADEDTRNFGGRAGPYKQSSTGSSWSLFSAFGGRRSREPSMGGSPWVEKGDPFSDGSALLLDEQTGFVGAAAPTAVATAALVRPRGAPRQASYASSRSGTSYRDPFSDPNAQEYHNIGQSDSEDEEAGRQGPGGMRRHPSYSDHPPPAISTMFPLGAERHLLSPLSEATSRHSLSDPSNTSHSSHEHGSTRTSMTSYDRIPSPKHNSLFDGQPIPAGRGVARSDTWWNRFSKTSFLDRRGSTSSRHSTAALDFRDPNPPPVRLSAIEEKSAHSQSPESMIRKTPPSASSSIRRKHSLYASVIHQKSTSSVKTADTAAIERMGGMDVVRLGSGSRHTRSSVGSSFDGLSLLEHPIEGSQIPIPVVASPVEAHDQTIPLASLASSSANRSPPADPSSSTQGARTTPTKRMSDLVSSRVGELQSRMNHEQEVLPPTNTRSREERVHKNGNRKSMLYGVVPRASLFVANPEA